MSETLDLILIADVPLLPEEEAFLGECSESEIDDNENVDNLGLGEPSSAVKLTASALPLPVPETNLYTGPEAYETLQLVVCEVPLVAPFDEDSKAFANRYIHPSADGCHCLGF